MQEEFRQPSYSDLMKDDDKYQVSWGVPIAFFNWVMSIIFAMIPALILIGIYLLMNPELMNLILSKGEGAQKALTDSEPISLLMFIGTFIGQVLTVLLSWAIVSGFGKQNGIKALGLEWGNFKWYYAIVIAVAMLGLTALLQYLLPHQETDLDKYLRMGMPVRLSLALAATLGAPIAEEVVYRGVLYSALNKSAGKTVAITIITILFWGVHVAQYYKSIAVLVGVLILSFVLTYLRAWTGKLLPCIAVHFVFNGIQGIGILWGDKPLVKADPQPAFMLFEWIKGLCYLGN